MPAPKGHPLWGNPLKPKKYSPEELWEKACAYIEWSDDHPLSKAEVIKSGESAGMIVHVPIDRPYSIERFCVFADISYQTFLNYEKEVGYETYFEVVSRIRKIIDSQHFEGGMIGVYNPSIVTRKLNLAEKQEIEHSGNVQTNIISFGGKEVEI